MRVNIVVSLNNIISREIEASSVSAVLSYLKYTEGKGFTDMIINNEYKYIISDSSGKLEPLPLLPQVVFSDLSEYDTLYIIPKIAGDGAAIVAAVAGVSAAAVAASATLSAIALLVNLAISLVLSFVVSLLSPTPEFDSDPQEAQLKQSSLYNGPRLIRGQGGIVPYLAGNPHAGGVLISSGISTEDIIL